MHALHAYLLRFVPELTEAEWQLLAAALQTHHLARGEHFVQAGEHRSALALMLTGQPSQFSIQALTDCELVVFDYAVLRRLYDEWAVYGRFGRLLASGKTKILERIPQHLVAHYLGITPVSLSRIRGRVARDAE